MIWKRLFKAGGISLLLGVILCASSFFYRCPVTAVIGIPCPGCGMTRALSSLIRLDFKTAMQYNPLLLLVIVLYGYVVTCYIFDKAKFAKSRWIWYPAIGVFLLFWIYRLIQFVSGNPLFPYEWDSILGRVIHLFWK